MKIAVLNCLKANEVCAGCACLKAFNSRTRHFAVYDGQDVDLAAFMRCNGCEADPRTDRGTIEKVDRLAAEQVEVVHVGVCTKTREGARCKNIETICEMLTEKGIRIVEGTH